MKQVIEIKWTDLARKNYMGHKVFSKSGKKLSWRTMENKSGTVLVNHWEQEEENGLINDYFRVV